MESLSRGAALFEKMITIVNYAIFNASYIFSISEGGNQKQTKKGQKYKQQ